MVSHDYVPALAHRALDRAEDVRHQAYDSAADTHSARAQKMTRVAELFEREARWWRVLSRHAYTARAVSLVYGHAAMYASLVATERSETYRDLAATSWRRALQVASDSGVAA